MSKAQREIDKIIEGGMPIKGTLAERWLQERGLQMPPCDDLLFHNHVELVRDSEKILAMIARIRGVDGLYNGALHFTYLNKVGINPEETGTMVIGHQDGGAVRLYPILTDIIGVAVDIESAISACLLTGIPTWAVLTTMALEAFKVPSEVRRIIIFSGGRETDVAASRRCAGRLMPQGIEVDVRLPDNGISFNDDLIKKFKLKKSNQEDEIDMSPPGERPVSDLDQYASGNDVFISPIVTITKYIKALPTDTSVERARQILASMSEQYWDPLSLRVALDALNIATDIPLGVLQSQYNFHKRQFSAREKTYAIKKEPFWRLMRALERRAAPPSSDQWFMRVSSYMETFRFNDTTTEEILVECLGLPRNHSNKNDKGRVAKILVHLGWKKFRQSRSKLTHRFRRPEADPSA